jgi:hypothetical protein
MKVNPDKVRAWKQRTRDKALAKLRDRTTTRHETKIKSRSSRRARQETCYLQHVNQFLSEYDTCPVTGEKTTQVHHSAKREGGWLNLRRYWIGVSQRGHELIEGHKELAERLGLMVRIRVPYRDHVQELLERGLSLTIPVFYETWNGSKLVHHFDNK